MPRYQVSHKTTYKYSAPVTQSHHILHLAPRAVGNQKIQRQSILVEPPPAWRKDRTDYFGNPMTLIALEAEHRELTVSAHSEVEVIPAAQPAFQATPNWEQVRDMIAAGGAEKISAFRCPSRHASPTLQLDRFARASFADGTPILEGARHLMQTIFDEFSFDNSTTDVSTPVQQVLEQKSGVCQDFAHLMIAAIRSLGLPARYVSGYIMTHPPEGQAKLEGSDASHAWVSVWSPDTGWVDFDPTNNLVNSPEHITIAHGRDFEDVSPISGVLLGGGSHSVEVAVDVRPVG